MVHVQCTYTCFVKNNSNLSKIITSCAA